MLLTLLAFGCHLPGGPSSEGLKQPGDSDSATSTPTGDTSTTDTSTTGTAGPPDCRENYQNAALISVESVTGQIYQIDPATAVVTVLSDLTGVPANANLNSSAFRADAIAIVSDATGRQLVSIDPCTGVVEVVGPTGVGALCGVAFGPGDRLYGLDGENNQLVDLDPVTGAATVIGSLGFDLGTCGLAYDCVNDELIAVDGTNSRLFRLDPNTGLAFDELATDVAFGAVGAEYDPRDETILASTGRALYRIDVATGLGTLVGPLEGEGNYDDLAYITVALECE